jgi:8-oxoguanine deaminase
MRNVSRGSQKELLARLQMGLLSPEGPRKLFLLSQSHPLRANQWMTAREALEVATLGGDRVLGRARRRYRHHGDEAGH